MSKKIYAIIDVETTGGRAARDKITEIGIVLFDGENILETFESLINPERAIPSNITRITGISDDMVAEAPRFFEVARKIVDMTEGAVFVAHNARFDYNFIREEFKRLGYTYTRRLLDTVRLSRNSFPGLRSYSLGNLIKHFGIKVNRRHRALDDALATTDILGRILRQDPAEQRIKDLVNRGIRESQLPENITIEKLHQLPEECGVYYFYDINGELIYIGKSVNIKHRVMQHFTNKNNKGNKLNRSVHDISYEITGSELVALLQESHEIKLHHPRINRAQRQRNFNWVITSYFDKEGYRCLDVKRAAPKKQLTMDVVHAFPSQLSAKGAINRMLENFQLCQLHCNIGHSGRPCFDYHLHKCKGACVGIESPEEYNARVHEAINAIGMDFDSSFIILDEGRSKGEKAVILVEEGQYKGFGYIDEEDARYGVEELKEAIKPYTHNPETVRIIRHYMINKSSRLKVIEF
ncbi:MAG: exonuclease domain-containing protein [Bacteroidota bacterium]